MDEYDVFSIDVGPDGVTATNVFGAEPFPFGGLVAPMPPAPRPIVFVNGERRDDLAATCNADGDALIDGVRIGERVEAFDPETGYRLRIFCGFAED